MKYLVEMLFDSQKGLATLGSTLRDTRFATYFKGESETRGAYARQLKLTGSLIDEIDDPDRPHYYWEIMAANAEDSDSTLLEIAKQEEQMLRTVYQKAIGDASLSTDVQELLRKQSGFLQVSYRIVRSFGKR